MKITIPKDHVVKIESLSSYNNNYYALPFAVNGCTILLCSYGGDELYDGGCVGNLDAHNKFHPKFWLHTDERDELSVFLFDSDEISETFKWT